MTAWIEQVEEFSKIANKAQNALDPEAFPLIPESETLISTDKVDFLSQMIRDELDELVEATTDYEQADAFLDIIYYTLDTAAKHGMSFELETDRYYPDRLPELIPEGIVGAIVKTFEGSLARLKDASFSGIQAGHLRGICLAGIKIADAHGFDLNPLFDIVQTANMAKFPNDVVSLDTDIASKRYGKVLKPEGWQKPDSKIKEDIERQKLVTDLKGVDIDGWLDEQRALHGND